MCAIGSKLNANFVPDYYSKRRKLRQVRLAKRRKDHGERFGYSKSARAAPSKPTKFLSVRDQYDQLVDTMKEQSLRLNGRRPKKPQTPPKVEVILPPVKPKHYRPRLNSQDNVIMDQQIEEMMRTNTENPGGEMSIGNPEHWQQRGYMTTPSPVPWGTVDLNLYPEEETHFEEDTTASSYFKSTAREHFFRSYQKMVPQEVQYKESCNI